MMVRDVIVAPPAGSGFLIAAAAPPLPGSRGVRPPAVSWQGCELAAFASQHWQRSAPTQFVGVYIGGGPGARRAGWGVVLVGFGPSASPSRRALRRRSYTYTL